LTVIWLKNPYLKYNLVNQVIEKLLLKRLK